MADQVKKRFQELQKKAATVLREKGGKDKIRIQIGSATCEHAAGSKTVREEFQKHILAAGRNDIILRNVGCTGRCCLEPIITLLMPGKPPVTYQKIDIQAVHEIFLSHIIEGKVVEKYLLGKATDEEMKEKEKFSLAMKILKSVHLTQDFYSLYGDLPFFISQIRIALRNAGIVDPENIYEYIERGGFQSLAMILDRGDSQAVVDEVSTAGLRGRGGAGFPTGKKWNFARANEEKIRYMICNADEGDPGAFMDRSMLESDPFSIIEGMIIAGFAIEAKRGFFYIRAEYPLAVERIQKAIDICRDHNLLGNKILGSSLDYDLEIRLGAGAFVCGEETALIHSIEGKRGQPTLRPPFPANKGLWGKPTIINNVETLANLSPLIAMSGKKFKEIGSNKSGGTKVFAISGKVRYTGLVEVPMGTTLRELVEIFAGGVPNGKKLKAVQTGGPAGGCIPLHLMDAVIDYESLIEVGSIMGSGGLIVLDEDDCMVQFARFFMGFSHEESCGKCTPCREGTIRLLEIIDRIIAGEGKLEDLEKLERLGHLMQKASLCGLGRSASNPVLSSLYYFRDEYEDHVVRKNCLAKQCTHLIHYEIDPEKCVGCTACAKSCPVSCISGVRKQPHVIDQSRCIKCGRCLEVCRFGAVKKL